MPCHPSHPVRIRLNGKPAEILPGQCLLDLLAARQLDPRAVMIEVNEQVVRRDEYAAVRPADGDRIEIVRMIAGG